MIIDGQFKITLGECRVVEIPLTDAVVLRTTYEVVPAQTPRQQFEEISLRHNSLNLETRTYCDALHLTQDGYNADESADTLVWCVFEQLLHMAKADEWIPDWECHVAAILHDYYHPSKA